MKIKTKDLPYEEVTKLRRPKHKPPRKPIWLLQIVIRVLTAFDLRRSRFSYTTHGMEKLPKKQPCLILMNHSSFVDMKIASKIFFPRRYGIVCTSDGFVGKRLLMRLLGCIPTQKFVSDLRLIRDMQYMLKKKKTSVLLFPEASYSFDGTDTPLPRKMGILLKKLDVPVVMVMTRGAFSREPLYNNLQRRKVRVSAEVTYLLSPEQIRELSVPQLDGILDRAFDLDNFAWQRDNHISISEPFRADGLERILYRCPHCGAEGQTEGKGVKLTCHSCKKVYLLTEAGELIAAEGETTFTHIPNWYEWQRGRVRQEIEAGTYCLETPVDIAMLVDYKAIYRVGSGKLVHNCDGFRLTGCNGKLNYHLPPLASYSLYSDYNWYEIGDVICIGDQDTLYYCFPQKKIPVAKARLAAEELYKLKKRRPAPTKV